MGTVQMLQKIKNRGSRYIPEDELKFLIQSGLVAGDFSRAYLTDLGDSVLELIGRMKGKKHA